MDQLLQLLFSGITLGGIYALIAAGFIVVYNITGIINFAQGEFVMLGAMLSISFHNSLDMPLPLAVVMAVVLVSLLGTAMDRLAIFPARHASLVTFIIITIGIAIAIRGTALLAWGTDPHALPGFASQNAFVAGNVSIATQGIWVLALSALCFLVLHLFFEHTYYGKAVKAAVINPNAARLMGISPQRLSLLAFGAAGAMGALAGAFIAPMTMGSYDMGLMLGLKGFVAAVLGGLSSIYGALLGGILLGVLESLGAGYISSGYRDALAFLILVLILFARPEGLLGKSGGKRV